MTDPCADWERAAMARVTIIGLGNRMRGDDAAGLLAVDGLGRRPLPESMKVVEAPEDPVRIIDMLAETDTAIIVDAADMAAQPGTVRVFRSEEDWTSVATISSVHSVGLQQLLPMARKLGIDAKVVLVAVQASSWDFGEEISPEVLQHVTELEETALKEAYDALEDLDHRR